jgi:hypothetical protein
VCSPNQNVHFSGDLAVGVAARLARCPLHPHCDVSAFTVDFSSYLADARALTNKLNLMRTSPSAPFPVVLHKLISLGFSSAVRGKQPTTPELRSLITHLFLSCPWFIGRPLALGSGIPPSNSLLTSGIRRNRLSKDSHPTPSDTSGGNDDFHFLTNQLSSHTVY